MRLLDRIRHQLLRIDLVGDVVSPVKWLRICHTRLTHSTYYRAIAELYGVGKSTTNVIFTYCCVNKVGLLESVRLYFCKAAPSLPSSVFM